MVGALLLDKVFRENFMSNPATRPDELTLYSQSYLRRFGEHLTELNPAEEALIASIHTNSIQQFCEILDRELSLDEEQVFSGSKALSKPRISNPAVASKHSERSTAA